MTPEQIIAHFDTNNDSMISWDEFWYAWNLEDDHDDHDHIAPEKVLTNISDCPADTVINVFHLEKGEYVVEFETEDEDVNEFHLAALPMLGAHAHHHHGEGHGDGDNHTDGHVAGESEHGVCHDMNDHSNHDEFTNKADCEAAGYMWLEEHENHQGDVCHDETTHQNTEHDNQADCEAAGHMWIESDEDGHGDHDGHGHGEHSDHDDHDEHHGKLGFLTIHIEAEGDYGFALPSNIEMFILSNGDSHEGHDHGSHGDSHGGHGGHGDSSAEMVCYDMSSHTVLTSYHDKDECETAGYMWVPADSGPGGDSSQNGQDDPESEIGADAGEDDFEYDPHSWLDPLSFKAQVNTVLAALIETFPEGEETFTTNADSFKTSLDKLHLDIIDGIGEEAGCSTDTVAANHNAYSYLSVRYGVDFVTVHGLDPEGEPAAADILEVIEKIEEDEILVLYIEEYTSASAVNSIVEATNVQVLYLYTMELPPKDDTDNYLSLMYKNLENLEIGLGCNV